MNKVKYFNSFVCHNSIRQFFLIKIDRLINCESEIINHEYYLETQENAQFLLTGNAGHCKQMKENIGLKSRVSRGCTS